MEPQITFEAHGNYVLGLHFTRDGRTLVSSGMDALVKLWDTSSWQEKAAFSGHHNSVNGFALSPDEALLATSSSDTTVRLWSFPDGQLLNTLVDQKKVASGVSFSPDGKWIASIYYGGRAVIWDLQGNPHTIIESGLKNLACAAYSPDSQLLAIGGLGSELTVWSAPDGTELYRLPGHEDAVMSARFLSDGSQLVSFSYRGVVRFWDTRTWQVLRSWQIQGGRGFTFSPDESWMAFSAPSCVQIYSTSTGQLDRQLSVSTPVVNGMAFSPDGSLLAAGAADRKIRIFQLMSN